MTVADVSGCVQTSCWTVSSLFSIANCRVALRDGSLPGWVQRLLGAHKLPLGMSQQREHDLDLWKIRMRYVLQHN